MLTKNNVIRIVGTLANPWTFSHELYGEKFYTSHINVQRLNVNVVDTLQIMTSERITNFRCFSVGNSVTIHGDIRVYQQLNEDNFSPKLKFTIFVHELSPQLSDITKNEVFLRGHIAKPPIHRFTPLGREITELLIRVPISMYKYVRIPCITWGRTARYAESFEVNQHLELTGRMQSRPYQKQLEDMTVELTTCEISVQSLCVL